MTIIGLFSRSLCRLDLPRQSGKNEEGTRERNTDVDSPETLIVYRFPVKQSHMYSKASPDDLETRSVEDVEPGLKAVGYELRPEKMRPSVWVFEEGESNRRHRQREQEELYVVLDGRFEVVVEEETFEIREGDFVVVPPESWRQLTALEESTLLVVGAPNVKDDAVLPGEE